MWVLRDRVMISMGVVVSAALAALALTGCADPDQDLCPDDPDKTEAGACGCGLADDDTNANGAPDCFDAQLDLCPADPAKTQGGTCGCGVSDADADGNGVPDCLDGGIDLCPADPAKTQAGACGCGVPDTDADLSHVPDCFETEIEFAYTSDYTFYAGLASTASVLVVINTSPAPIDLSTAQLQDVTVDPACNQLAPTVFAASGTLGAGVRTNDLNLAAEASLSGAGLIPEAVGGGSLDLGFINNGFVVGDCHLRFTLAIAGQTAPIDTLFHFNNDPSGTAAIAGPTRVRSTPMM